VALEVFKRAAGPRTSACCYAPRETWITPARKYITAQIWKRLLPGLTSLLCLHTSANTGFFMLPSPSRESCCPAGLLLELPSGHSQGQAKDSKRRLERGEQKSRKEKLGGSDTNLLAWGA